MVPKSSRFSGTRARPIITRSSSVASARSWPSKTTVPREGSTPISAFSVVDLPAPLGPITVTTWPLSRWKFRPLKTSARP